MAECEDVAEQNWIYQRIDATEAMILAVEAAITTVAGGATSYTLDSGQTRQTVTKSTSGELKNTLSELENRRAVLKAQLNGKKVNLRPGW
jgi:hypothetical protein